MYYITLLVILSLGVLLCEVRPYKSKTKLYLAVSMLIMAALFTFRYGMGYDFYSYQRIFESISDTTNFSSLLTSSHMKAYPMFTLLNYVVSLFTDNYIFLNAVFAIVMFGCLGVAIYRFSPIPWISIFCFVTLLFFYMSMNFVRQAMALNIILFAYPFLKQKRIIPYTLIVLLASSIHLYALIMLPAFFLITMKLDKRHYAVLISVWTLCFVFSEEVLKLLGHISPRIRSYLNTMYLQKGNNIQAVFFSIVCFVVVLSFHRLLTQKDKANTVLLNLSFFSLLFSLFSVRHAIIDRFAHYFTIFMILTLAEIANCLKPHEECGYNSSNKDYRRQLRTQRFNYRWYLCSLVLVLMLNHTYAEIRNTHRVFPYHTVFNEKWKQQVDYIYYEIGDESWVLREILPEELPEELR